MKSSIKEIEGLKNLLSKWDTEKNDPVSSFMELSPEKSLAERKRIEHKWGDVIPREPRPFELKETLHIICSAWKQEGKINHINYRHLKRTPWILFYEKPWPGEDYAFVQAFLEWLWGKKNSACVVSLLREFLHEYPQQLPTFELLRSALTGLLNNTETIRLSRWRERCEKYHLLLDKDKAPLYFAQEWLNSDVEGLEMLNERHASLTGRLAQSNFLLLVHKELFQRANILLTQGSITEKNLKRILRLSEQEDSKLRFPNQKKNIAESLLLPFGIEKNPEPEQQKLIENFILNHFGDPRYGYKISSEWYEIDERAREVIIRWRIKVTLDDFFRLLDVTALDKHWKSRHKFWKAYLNREYITGAWVILGKEAKSKATDVLENSDYAEGKGMGRDQAVLLLKVGGITILEWSHNGSCRIWLQNNNASPEFYRSNYDGTNLRSGSDETFRHSGDWQKKLTGKIEDLTGIYVPDREYRV